MTALFHFYRIQKSFRDFTHKFFKSWYGHLGALLIQVVLSALLVTFYTTEISIVKSFGNKAHFITLLLNAVLMVPLTLIIGMVVYALDTSVYWLENKVGRWLFQFAMLGVVLGLIVLYSVRLIYQGIFNVDLFEIDYVNRDFILVLVCIVLQQVYYMVRKVQRDHKAALESLEEYRDKMKALEQRNSILEEGLADLQWSLDLERKRCRDLREPLAYFFEVLWCLKQEVGISYDSMPYEHVPIRFVARVYIKAGESNKLFYATLLDAKEVLIDINSLTSLEGLYPSILIKNKKNELVNMAAIKGIKSREGKSFLALFGVGEIEMNKEQKEKIIEYRARLRQEINKAKELLNIERDLVN